ncbi:MAG: hypothetical protein PHN69_04735 [Candidatus Pacebacteria bacterium]|nr:hypothetical protein [Candidatus Paceibacterota bacterium]
MLAGITLEEATTLIGTKGRTSIRGNIRRTLNKLGIQTGEYFRLSKNSPLPEPCLIKMRYPSQIGKKYSHLIILSEGHIYDPAKGKFALKEYYKTFPGVKFNGCLLIKKAGIKCTKN